MSDRFVNNKYSVTNNVVLAALGNISAVDSVEIYFMTELNDCLGSVSFEAHKYLMFFIQIVEC